MSGEHTPIEDTMIGQDTLDGSDGLFIENSLQFEQDMKQINDLGGVFVGLGLLFALASLLIYRKLVKNESMKVDFNEDRRQAEQSNGASSADSAAHQSEMMKYSQPF